MELPPMSCFSYVTANPSNASIEDRDDLCRPGVGCSSYYGYRIANVVCVWQKNQYVDKMQQRCNDNEKNVKRYQKNG